MSSNCKSTIFSLAEVYRDYFKIGAAVTINVKKHFNSLTAENAMKFGEIHPEEDRYDFEKPDKMKEFALNNNMKMRGHTFVWHNQTSSWIFLDKSGKEASRELVLERLKRRWLLSAYKESFSDQTTNR